MKANALISTDEDFWDPGNKANTKGKHFQKSAPVKSNIFTDFSISILLPSEFISTL